MYLVASFKFEPMTLARLDCIPTRAHGNEKNEIPPAPFVKGGVTQAVPPLSKGVRGISDLMHSTLALQDSRQMNYFTSSLNTAAFSFSEKRGAETVLLTELNNVTSGVNERVAVPVTPGS